MGTVLRLAKHVLFRCSGEKDECMEGRCMFCSGGLSMCTVCGGAEGSMPTDCPGEPMSWDTGQQVYEGLIDYRRGQGWITLQPSERIG